MGGAVQVNMDDYAADVYRTAAHDLDATLSLATWGLGLAGEGGEVLASAVEVAIATALAADGIKKVVGHGHELNRDKLVKELGDVLWYVAQTANEIGVPLSVVAKHNTDKLKARYPKGFSTERSVNR